MSGGVDSSVAAALVLAFVGVLVAALAVPAFGMNLLSTKLGMHSWEYSNDYNPSARAKMQHVDLVRRFEDLAVALFLGIAAGLHFTPEILALIRQIGVEIVEVTLHVGLGTFSPVKVESLADHQMHEERYWVAPGAAEKIVPVSGPAVSVAGSIAAPAESSRSEA